MEETKVTVIGAGVVGLAIAAVLSETVGEVLVLERQDGFGREVSSRSSEVIHSGLYYEMDSLKSRLCQEGAKMLYAYCEGNGIAHAKRGKYIVATEDSDLKRLEELFQHAKLCGVRDVEYMDGRQVSLVEPAVRCHAALLSASTGTLDSHALMKTLYDEAASKDVVFAFGRDVTAIEKTSGGIKLSAADETVLTQVVINSAGLGAPRIAEIAGIDTAEAGYELQYVKGTWFGCGRQVQIKKLIYPLPGAYGLGIHTSIDPGGRLRFGPDAEVVDDPMDMGLDPSKGDAFHEAIIRYLPEIRREDIYPEMAGIRPALKGEGFRDFIIKEESDRGISGLINLIGIESPGLTCCLSIAKEVNALVQESLA